MPFSNNFMLYEWREIDLGDKCTFSLRYLWNATTWASKIKCLWEKRNLSDLGGSSTAGGIVLGERSNDSEVAQKEVNFCEILFNRVNLKNHDPVRYTSTAEALRHFLISLYWNSTSCKEIITKNENIVSLLLLLFSS